MLVTITNCLHCHSIQSSINISASLGSSIELRGSIYVRTTNIVSCHDHGDLQHRKWYSDILQNVPEWLEFLNYVSILIYVFEVDKFAVRTTNQTKKRSCC